MYMENRNRHTYRKQISGYQRGEGRESEGVQDSEIQTTVYKIDKQQGYIVQHKELQSLSCNNF